MPHKVVYKEVYEGYVGRPRPVSTAPNTSPDGRDAPGARKGREDLHGQRL